MAVTLTRPPAPPEADEDAPMPYSRADFRRLAATYPDLRMERTKDGEIVIRPPALTGTGNRNFKIALQLGRWSSRRTRARGSTPRRGSPSRTAPSVPRTSRGSRRRAGRR